MSILSSTKSGRSFYLDTKITLANAPKILGHFGFEQTLCETNEYGHTSMIFLKEFTNGNRITIYLTDTYKDDNATYTTTLDPFSFWHFETLSEIDNIIKL